MEENTTCENKKECGCEKIKCLITLLTFVFALTAMVYTIIINNKINVMFKAFNINSKQVQEEAKNDFLISEKYDNGQTLAKAKETGKPILAFFYVDWCGYCKRFAPTFADIQKDKDMNQDFAFAFVNCEAPENEELLKEYEIQGFPSVFVIKGDKKTHIDNEILYGDYENLKAELKKSK